MRGDTRILPEGWVAAMTAMKPLGPAEGFPGYGLQTWQVDDEPGAFAAVGLAGQMIYVHPASRTVIVKLSYWLPVPEETTVPDTLAFFKAYGQPIHKTLTELGAPLEIPTRDLAAIFAGEGYAEAGRYSITMRAAELGQLPWYMRPLLLFSKTFTGYAIRVFQPA